MKLYERLQLQFMISQHIKIRRWGSKDFDNLEYVILGTRNKYIKTDHGDIDYGDIAEYIEIIKENIL